MTDEVQIFNTSAPAEHADIHVIDANETYLFGSRGSLKTWLGGALYILRRVFEMPRSTGACLGVSFEQMMDNTLPPLKSFFSSRGIIENEHYVLMKPPPDHWDKPYAGVEDPSYKHAWTWFNGTMIQIISSKRIGSALGASFQWAYIDETKLLSQKFLEEKFLPTVRSNELSHPFFKDCSGYLSKFFATDKLADPVAIEWLLKKRDLVDHKKIELVRSIQYRVFDLMDQLEEAKKKDEARLLKQIADNEFRLSKLRANLVNVAEINADDVRPIMGDRWYKDKQKNSTKHIWDIVYLNKDPDRPAENFYPAFDKKIHVHNAKNDIDPNLPLILSADYQASVSPIPLAQIAPLPGYVKPSLNYVDEVHTVHPAGLRDAVKLFCDKFKFHSCKDIYYAYDHTAVAERNDADSFYKIVIDELKNNDWTVWEIYTGQAPGHYEKYTDTMEWMKNEKQLHLDIRINIRCKKLIKSIEKAGTRTVGNETKKDKRPEIIRELDQTETTHFSDAFDTTNDAVLKQKLIAETIQRIPFAFGK